MIDADVSIGVVERAIETSPLSREEKSELWLAAWSRRHPSVGESEDDEAPAWGPEGPSRPRAVAAMSSGLLAHD